ncbi:MAG: hypothetical protein Q8P18_32140 [Pseudomonadota bacterium]|nr:hypothetical protein [Pseudomonadota bacterium]
MSSLPPELAAWSAVLAGFVPDLAEPLGVLARRLELVIGRVRARPRPLGDDPDGYDGLDRRGPYDRLVLSEWALADAVPEEFDRRAASGEQSFLRLDRRDRSKGVRCVALFDGGPSQLGGPRVVQLAALVVLWRRALAAGADFSWGTLTGTVSGPVLQDRVDRATIQAFLGGRSGRPTTSAELLAARAYVGNVDELWLIGAPVPDALVALAPRLGQPAPLLLALQEVVAPDVNAVDVRLTRGGAPLGEARLDLPAPAIARRLLVDPFQEVAPPPRVRPVVPPPPEKVWRPFPRGGREPSLVRFVPGTQQLVVLLKGGLTFSWGFDPTLRSPKPKQHFIPDEPLVAVGYHHQRAIGITKTREGELRPSWYGSAFPPARVVGPTPVLGAGTIVIVDTAILFVDTAGTLYSVDGAVAEEKVIRAQATNVVALFSRHQHVVYVVRSEGRLVVKQWQRDPLHVVGEVEGDTIWVGRGGELLVTRTADGPRAWIVPLLGPYGQPALHPLAVPALRSRSETLLGAGSITHNDIRPVVHDPALGTLYHAGTNVTITPPRTPIDLTLSQDGSVVAWRTEEGFVEAWSFVTGGPVLQRHGA